MSHDRLTYSHVLNLLLRLHHTTCTFSHQIFVNIFLMVCLGFGLVSEFFSLHFGPVYFFFFSKDYDAEPPRLTEEECVCFFFPKGEEKRQKCLLNINNVHILIAYTSL